MEGEIEVKTGLQLSEESKKRGKPSFKAYATTLPSKTPTEVLLEEKAWFDKTIDELRWLNEAKKRILSKSDYQDIGSKMFIKKSGVKKLALAMGISVEIVDRMITETTWGDKVETIPYQSRTGTRLVSVSARGKEVLWHVRARATRKDGVFCEALAICSNYELAIKKGQDYNPQSILGLARQGRPIEAS